MVHSCRKGKNFEREVANLLTQLTGKKFQRVPCSGATATSQGAKSPIFKGDVFCEEEPYNDLVIECKITGRVMTLADILREKSDLWAWWKQAKEEAAGNRFILVFRYKRGPLMMLSPSDPESYGRLCVSSPRALFTSDISVRLHDFHGDEVWISFIDNNGDGA